MPHLDPTPNNSYYADDDAAAGRRKAAAGVMAQFTSDGDAGDASVLNFGSVGEACDGDENVQFLMNHEVVYALSRLRDQREENGEAVPNVMSRALEHCKERAACADLDMTKMLSFTQSVHSQLDAMIDEEMGDEDPGNEKLHRFEIASLVNLMDSEREVDPNDPATQLDELMKIIPSVERFSKDFLVEVLQVLKRERDELKLDPETDGVFDDDDDDEEQPEQQESGDGVGNDAGGSMGESQEVAPQTEAEAEGAAAPLPPPPPPASAVDAAPEAPPPAGEGGGEEEEEERKEPLPAAGGEDDDMDMDTEA